ncbi:MAG: hypothetical protein R3E88_05835 [Myxococcota bacterium]
MAPESPARDDARESAYRDRGAVSGAARRARRARRAGWIALCAIAAVAPYLSSLDDALVWDDRFAIGPGLDVDGVRGLARLWVQPFEPLFATRGDGASYYRPVVTTTLALDRALFGDATAGFHATNLAWHAASAIALFALALALLAPGAARRDGPREEWRAALAAVLFALHPAHAEPVCLIMGRSDPVASVFLFAAIALALRGAAIAPAALVLAGAFAKEVALLGAPVVALAAWLRTDTGMGSDSDSGSARASAPLRASRARAVALVVVAAAIAVAIRLSIPGLALGRESVPLPEGALARFGVGLGVVADYALSVVAPVNLSALRQVPALSPLRAAAGALVVALLALAFARGLARRRAAALPPALFAATLLPLCWPPALAGIAMADRFLYVPTAAFALAVAALPRRAAIALGVAFAAAFSALLPARVAIWDDQVALFESVLRDSGESSFVHSILSREHRRRGDAERTLAHALRAHELEPGEPLALESLVQLEVELGRAQDARAHANAAIERAPDDALGWYLLGLAELGAGDAAAAARTLERAIAIAPSHSAPHAALALARHAQGDAAGALAAMREAARLDPGNAPLAARLRALEQASESEDRAGARAAEGTRAPGPGAGGAATDADQAGPAPSDEGSPAPSGASPSAPSGAPSS